MRRTGDTETERVVLSHYLVHRRADLRDASVGSDHFADFQHKSWWLGAVNAGVGWKPGDIGLDADNFALLSAIRPTVDDVREAEQRLVRSWQVRYIGQKCREIVEGIQSGRLQSSETALGQFREALAEAEAGGVLEAQTHREIGIEVFRDWTDAQKSDRHFLLPMPLRGLNERLGGWRRGKYYLVGAVTSTHKTTFVRESCWHVAKVGEPALLWSMEDSAKEMAARTFAAEVKQVDTRTFTTYRKPEGISDQDLRMMLDGVFRHLESEASTRLRYLDLGLPRLGRVLSVLSAEAARGLSFVGLDFFQLIRADTARIDEVEHWFTTSNALAAAAKRLNLVILASVQPTQSATKEQERNRRFLTKGDLRGGSAIAQAAYGVLLFNRVYDEDGELDRRYLDVDISKWKNADTGTVRVKVDRAKDLIVD
jgi:replicative DNA helicase